MTRSLAFVLVLVLSACTAAAVRQEQPALGTSPAATAPSSEELASLAFTASAPPMPTSQACPKVSTASASGAGSESLPAHLRTLHLEIPAGNSYEPKAMAIHPVLDRVYVRSHDGWASDQGLVTVVDLSSMQVIAAVATAPDIASDGGMVVDTVRDRVYAVNRGMATATVLDARTLGVLEALPDVLLLALDEAGGHVYVAGREGLRVLDAERLETLARAPLPAGSLWLAMGLDPAAGRLYLAGRPPAGNSLEVYDTAGLVRVASTPLGGGPESLVVDTGRRRLYIALNAGSHSLLWVMDAEGRLLEERDLGQWLGRIGLALEDEGSRLFLAHESRTGHAVRVFDPDTWETMAILPLSLSPYSLTWDAHSQCLLVSHPAENAISVVNVDARRVMGMIATAVELVDLEVDPERGHLYITDRSGRLRVFDSDTDAELATLPAQGTISIDGPHGRLYTGGSDPFAPVRVFDAERLEQIGALPMWGAQPVADPYSGGLYLVRAGVYIASLQTMTVTGVLSDTLPPPEGWNPSPAAVDAMVDPGTGRLFVVMNNGSTSTSNGNYLNVYEPGSLQKAYSDPELSVSFLDVDPAAGRVYVSRTGMTNRSISLLEDGRTCTARLDSQVGKLRVDAGLGRLYVNVNTMMGEELNQLLVLGAGSLEPLGTVSLPAGLNLQALDAQRHLLYLANVEGEVQIWSAAADYLPERP